jgi:hypothetical protein
VFFDAEVALLGASEEVVPAHIKNAHGLSGEARVSADSCRPTIGMSYLALTTLNPRKGRSSTW